MSRATTVISMDQTNRYLISADIRLDCIEQKLYQNNQVLNLPSLSFNVLRALMLAQPNHLTFDELIDQVWQHQAVNSETVTQRIAMIRKALNQDEQHQYISSVRSKGYRWIPEVKQSHQSKINHKLPRQKIFIMALMAISCLLLLFKNFSHDQNESTNQATAHVSPEDLTKQAYHYLKQHNANSNQIAVELFRKSLEQDPNQISALIGLSNTLSHQVTKFNQPNQLLIEARAHAEHAIHLDDTVAQSWAALAFVDDASGHIDLAIAGYEKAINLAPNDLSTVSSLAYLYTLKGRLAEALKLNLSAVGSRQFYLDIQIAQTLELLDMQILAEQWYEKADTLSPDNVFVTYLRAQFYLSNGQTQKAQQLITGGINKGIKRSELLILQGIIEWKTERYEAATKSFQLALAIDNSFQAKAMLFALALHTKTNKNSVQSFLDESLQQPFTWPDQWVYSATIHAQSDNPNQAFNDLEQAIKAGFRNDRWLQVLPAFDHLKGQPRWLQIIEAIHSQVTSQREQVLKADWLPEGFLNPQSR